MHDFGCKDEYLKSNWRKHVATCVKDKLIASSHICQE